jgi:hypothetical protein
VSGFFVISVRAKALPQFVEALRADGESALADFHVLSEGFIPTEADAIKNNL